MNIFVSLSTPYQKMIVIIKKQGECETKIFICEIGRAHV